MMSLTLAFGAMALWSMIATVEVVGRDGHGAAPFDPEFDTRFGAGR